MTERQYVRANSSLYPILMVLFGVLFLLGVGIFFEMGVDLSPIMQVAASAILIIVDTYTFMKKKNTKECATIMMASGAVMYIVIMLFNHNNNVYIYALPVVCFSIIYLNVKYVMAGGIITFIGIIIHAVKLAIEHSLDSQTLIIVAVVAALLSVGAYRVCALLTGFNQENIEAQSKSYETMIMVADNLGKHFDTAIERLESTKNSVNVTKLTMEEISDSTGSTAEAISQQAVMCSEITESTNKAEEKAKSMIQSSENTLNTVEDGAKIIIGLKEQAENVQAASRDAAESSKELSTRVEEVRSIISTILSISSQTNLLALNASIEAARAGEAGKGFAVVADEIRQLSEQTQEATTKITDIINDLNAEVIKTVGSMEKSSESITKQNELIDVTKEKFDSIDNEVKSLTDIIRDIELVMKSIIDATDVITDNISHLSATSEEIAASTTEGVRISEESYNNTLELVDLIQATYELSKELKGFKVEEK